MKNVKIVQLLLILIYTVSGTIAHSQTDYVVTTKGDTVFGKIKYLNYGTSKSVQVTTTDKKKTTYPILQTKGFCLANEIYHPVKLTQGYTFMKPLKEGYLSLYAYQVENQTTWDGRLLLKKDGNRLDVPNLGFKKAISRFLDDCPDVVSKLEAKELSKTKINEIVDKYNLCVHARTKVTIQKVEVSNKQKEQSDVWTDLETAIRNGNDFENRSDALDMVTDIKSKILKSEKIPNFLLEGLRNSLSQQEGLKELLEKAISELK